jgi:hypothetical protein
MKSAYAAQTRVKEMFSIFDYFSAKICTYLHFNKTILSILSISLPIIYVKINWAIILALMSTITSTNVPQHFREIITLTPEDF